MHREAIQRVRRRRHCVWRQSEIGAGIRTSTLLAAWDAAQIGDGRLEEAMTGRGYLEATREILHRHNGLWFLDESYVVSCKRD